MKKRLLLVLTALILVFAMVACTPKPQAEEPPTEEVPTVEEPEVDVPADPVVEEDDDIVSYEEITLTPIDAFDIYREEYPDKLVSKIELDKYFDSYVYKVAGFNEDEETEVKIDPVNGDIIDTDTELDIDLEDQGEITIANVEKIQELLDKSLLDAGAGSMVDQWTLEWDEGILKLELDIDLPETGDIDYTYNIETGELLEKKE